MRQEQDRRIEQWSANKVARPETELGTDELAIVFILLGF